MNEEVLKEETQILIWESFRKGIKKKKTKSCGYLADEAEGLDDSNVNQYAIYDVFFSPVHLHNMAEEGEGDRVKEKTREECASREMQKYYGNREGKREGGDKETLGKGRGMGIERDTES